MIAIGHWPLDRSFNQLNLFNQIFEATHQDPFPLPFHLVDAAFRAFRSMQPTPTTKIFFYTSYTPQEIQALDLRYASHRHRVASFLSSPFPLLPPFINHLLSSPIHLNIRMSFSITRTIHDILLLIPPPFLFLKDIGRDIDEFGTGKLTYADERKKGSLSGFAPKTYMMN